MTDQKLVDELEKALRDEAYDGGFGYMGDEQFTAYVRTLAEAAAEVVEKALTPTDADEVISEREALDYLDEMNEAGRIEYDDYRNLHDLISGAVEPAREMFPGTLAALDDLTTLPKKGQER